MHDMNKRSYVSYLIIASCCVALAAIVVWQYHDKRHVARIPLTRAEGTGFLTLKACLNGKEILMAVDTAANRTTFDMRLIEELELSNAQKAGISFRFASNDMPLKTAHVKDFRLGKLSYHGDFCFADFSQTNKGLEAAEDAPIQGLLGADFLFKWHARIDYNDMSLVIRNR